MRHPIALVSLALVVGTIACRPTAESESDPLQQAQSAVEAGEFERALELLDGEELSGDEPDSIRLFALLGLERYDEAIGTLPDELSPQSPLRAVITEACVRAVLASAQGSGGGSATVARCDGFSLESAAYEAALLRTRLDEAPRASVISELLTRLRAEEGAYVDEVAVGLEADFVSLHEAASDDAALAHRWLMHAFEARQSPEIAERFIATTMELGDAHRDTDPQLAVGLYEHLYLPMVPGLEVPEDTQELATDQVHIALYPIIVENYRARYARKWLEEDTESGRYNPETETFHFGPYDSDEERIREVAEWAYHVLERPQPDLPPDFLAATDECPDLTQECVVGIERIVHWLHDVSDMEEDRARSMGLQVSYAREDEDSE